ncbi:hypothetical protein POM88_053796 [Heracleum sosnowskyi]|uniref:Uncharacterized protein n=1 Tax=Heracleum sosnowskyi TaxID=360622 RepID=A0AAD8LXD4_9APIA|nr:hypothetical protein POM88_053796 [Heracleum sosnowskyi]
MNGKIFLAELKRRLPYKVNIKDIRSKLTMIFHEYQCKRSGYRSFRIRIGKDVCYIFDQLVAHKDYAIFEKTDETSVKSCGTSSSKRSCTNADIRNAERKADIHRVALELEDLELNEDQIGSALFKLTNPNMQIGFWACRTRGIRRHFVLHMLNQYHGAKDQETQGETKIIRKGDTISLQDLLFTKDRDYLVRYNGDQQVKAAHLTDGCELFERYGGLGYPFSDEWIEYLEIQDAETAKKPSLNALLGSLKRDYVISSKGDKVPIDTLEEKVVALYFYEEDEKMGARFNFLNLLERG